MDELYLDTTWDYFVRVVYKTVWGSPREAYELWLKHIREARDKYAHLLDGRTGEYNKVG